MKLAFILPFYRTKEVNSLTGPLFSIPSLIGNIKDIFPDVSFEQIDLDNEIEKAIKDNLFNRKDFLFYKRNIEKLGGNIKKMTGNRFKADYYIPNDRNFNHFKKFLERIFNYNKLSKFDHYFLSVYQVYQPDISAMFLMAKFLKKMDINKKIIIGGLREFNGYLSKKIKNLNFVDSLVIDYGEGAVEEIINSLNKKKELRKVYNIIINPKKTLGFPDYKSFRNLDNFEFNTKNLEKKLKIKFKKENKFKNIFLPYRFSVGCFWSKCAYCSHSRHKNTIFYTKK